MKKLLMVLGFLIASSIAAQQNMNVLYDPKATSKPAVLAAPEKNRIVTDAQTVAGVTLKKHCPYVEGKWTDPQNVFAMSGSFSKKDTKQNAYAIFSPGRCHPEGEFGLIVLIYESQKLLHAFLVISGMRMMDEVYSVRDVNTNKLSELAIVSAFADGGGADKQLHLLEWNGKQFNFYGALLVSSFSSDGGENGGAYEYNPTVYVAKGPQPIFVGLEGGSTTRLTLLSLQKPSLQIIPLR